MGASPDLVTFSLMQPTLLAVAWMVGEVIRRIVKPKVAISKALMTVVSVLGISLGGLLVGWFQPGSQVIQLETLGVMFLVDLGVISLVAAVLWSRYPVRAPLSIAEQIAAGESDQVEFKSTARVNLHTGKRDEKMELVVAKTLAAFYNAGGGTLIVGVDDAGMALGLEADFATLKQPDQDRYELWLRDLLQSKLGTQAATLAKVEFAELGQESRLACRITCPPAMEPVYLRPDKGSSPQLWLRVGNSTRCLDVDDAVSYVQRRFPSSLSRTARDKFIRRQGAALQRLANRFQAKG